MRDLLLIRKGKIELGMVRFRHTTETLTMSMLTISIRGNVTDEHLEVAQISFTRTGEWGRQIGYATWTTSYG